jgi:uncharacterized protein (DUF2141 family)
MKNLHVVDASVAIALSIFGLIATNPLIAQTSPGLSPQACPMVIVEGLKSGQGVLYVAAYSSEETFSKKALWQMRVKVVEASMQFALCDVKTDEIAFTSYQDLNENGKLDANPLGIPNEPYGASGSPPMFSGPTWQTTKVKFDSTSIIIVKM